MNSIIYGESKSIFSVKCAYFSVQFSLFDTFSPVYAKLLAKTSQNPKQLIYEEAFHKDAVVKACEDV